MERRDWNLLVLSAAGGEPFPPAQLQKSLFLLEKNLPKEVLGEDFYHFEPNHYGPFDPSVYSDASALADLGLARASQSPSGRWTEYAATPAGVGRAGRLESSLPAGVADYVRELVRWVHNQPFTSLVRRVYERYPEMKVNSVFRG